MKMKVIERETEVGERKQWNGTGITTEECVELIRRRKVVDKILAELIALEFFRPLGARQRWQFRSNPLLFRKAGRGLVFRRRLNSQLTGSDGRKRWTGASGRLDRRRMDLIRMTALVDGDGCDGFRTRIRHFVVLHPRVMLLVVAQLPQICETLGRTSATAAAGTASAASAASGHDRTVRRLRRLNHSLFRPVDARLDGHFRYIRLGFHRKRCRKCWIGCGWEVFRGEYQRSVSLPHVVVLLPRCVPVNPIQIVNQLTNDNPLIKLS